ncbi:MAG: hypothetical protein ACSLEL_04285 [Candidatus Malihini olakiniferum]
MIQLFLRRDFAEISVSGVHAAMLFSGVALVINMFNVICEVAKESIAVDFNRSLAVYIVNFEVEVIDIDPVEQGVKRANLTG